MIYGRPCSTWIAMMMLRSPGPTMLPFMAGVDSAGTLIAFFRSPDGKHKKCTRPRSRVDLQVERSSDANKPGEFINSGPCKYLAVCAECFRLVPTVLLSGAAAHLSYEHVAAEPCETRHPGIRACQTDGAECMPCVSNLNQKPKGRGGFFLSTSRVFRAFVLFLLLYTRPVDSYRTGASPLRASR
jgi:hypothetical protein